MPTHGKRLLGRREYDELTSGLIFASELLTRFENRLNIPSRQRMTLDHLDHCYQSHDYRFLLKNIGLDVQLLAGRLEFVYEALASFTDSSDENQLSAQTLVRHFTGESFGDLRVADSSPQSANSYCVNRDLDRIKASLAAYVHEESEDLHIAMSTGKSQESSSFRSDVSPLPKMQQLQSLIPQNMIETHERVQEGHQMDYDKLPDTFATFERKGLPPKIHEPMPVPPMAEQTPAWIDDENFSIPIDQVEADRIQSPSLNDKTTQVPLEPKSKSSYADYECY